MLDVGLRVEGARAFARALRKGGVVATDVGAVGVGQLVVVSVDAPSLQLW
jgi:hypothetical protein